MNRPGIGGPSWKRRMESATCRIVSGRWTASSETGLPSMNLRDEVALRADEGDDLRAHPDAGRRDRRRVLDLAADPQQVRVVAGQAEDVPVARTRRGDQEVPVRDPARERHEARARGRPGRGRAASPGSARRAARPAVPRPSPASSSGRPPRSGRHLGTSFVRRHDAGIETARRGLRRAVAQDRRIGRDDAGRRTSRPPGIRGRPGLATRSAPRRSRRRPRRRAARPRTSRK